MTKQKKLLSVRKNKIHFSQTVSLLVKRFSYTLKPKGDEKMSTPNLKNKSIDELREIKAKGEAELKVLHNKSKYYESQINLLTRKERTHRLCTRGAMLEKFLGCPNELTDEQVEEILKIAFHPEAVGRAIEQFRESNENTTL